MNAILCTGDYRGINQGGKLTNGFWQLTSTEFCTPVKHKHHGWVCKWCSKAVKW